MGDSVEIVQAYCRARASAGDGLEAILATDVRFTSPGTELRGAASVIARARAQGGELRGLRHSQHGEFASLVYDFVTPGGSPLPCAEIVRTESGKIADIQLYYDVSAR